MVELSPNTTVRVSLAELAGVSFAGDPSSVTLRYATTGDSEELASGEPVTVHSCPELVTCEWEYMGVMVEAQLDVVPTCYCTLDEIRAYRMESYQNDEADDASVFEVRSRAIETIEREANRYFQPVVRPASVDRPNCSPNSLPFVAGGIANDIMSVLRSVRSDGFPLNVRVATVASLDVSCMRPGETAEAVLMLGMPRTPSEVRDAVIALAAYYLSPKAGADNATSMSTDAGVINYITAGVGGAATSLPEVNAVIQRYGVRSYMVG